MFCDEIWRPLPQIAPSRTRDWYFVAMLLKPRASTTIQATRCRRWRPTTNRTLFISLLPEFILIISLVCITTASTVSRGGTNKNGNDALHKIHNTRTTRNNRTRIQGRLPARATIRIEFQYQLKSCSTADIFFRTGSIETRFSVQQWRIESHATNAFL